MKLKEIIPVQGSKTDTQTTVPEVSVIILAYNHEKYIEECLKSVLNQSTNFEYEVIIGEDNSTDNTRKICKEYAEQFSNKIKLYLHHSENKIYVNNKPTGKFNLLYSYAKAKGRYIAICEGDDFWTDDYKLQRQYDYLEQNPECAIHCGHAKMVADNSFGNGERVHYRFTEDKKFGVEEFAENSPIVTCTAMFRNVGYLEFPEGILKSPAADWYNWVYVLQRTGGKVFYENRNLAAYRVHEGGVYSSLSSLGHHRFYEQNLKVIAGLLENPDLKCRARNKRNWYLEQIFRHYLGEGRRLKSLSVLPALLLNGYGFKSALLLLMEWKSGK